MGLKIDKAVVTLNKRCTQIGTTNDRKISCVAHRHREREREREELQQILSFRMVMLPITQRPTNIKFQHRRYSKKIAA